MATVSVRVEDDLKTQVEEIFSKMGLSVAAATNVFYHQVINYGRIPFELTAGNDTEYLNALPGMSLSIQKGMRKSKEKLYAESDLPW